MKELRGDTLSAVTAGVAVFLAGGALLSLEIASSRVMAPYFGSSLFVWGALIGIVLAGLSLGYWLGGILADRWATPTLFVSVLAVAGVLVLAIPFVDERILDWVVAWNPGPRLNPVVATIAIFGLQSIVLGTVSPLAVKLLARSLERLGRTAGRLFAVSTAGSIAGTFATAFFLIPELGTDQLIATLAVVLLLAAGAVALVERLALVGVGALALAALSIGAVVSLEPQQPGSVVSASKLQNWSPVYRQRGTSESREERPDFRADGYEVLYEKDTQYHRVAVVDDGESRFLRFDNSFQSGMFVDDPYATRFDYVDYLHLALAYRPQARRVLFVGLGGGSAPKRMWRDFPSLRIDAVEIDPAVVDVAYRFFGLPRDDRLQVTAQDGRRFLAQNDGPWDAIVIDAFYADSIPFHLATAEFLQLAQSRLRPGGVVVTNVIGAVGGAQSRLLRSMVRTYGTVFPTVAVHPVFQPGDEDPTAIRNVILVASAGAPPAEDFLAARWRDVRRRAPGTPELDEAIENRLDRPLPVADVPVLTDDYAPTDALLLLFG
ncbi:MAG TPA: fused MFS/spermidine synthase [Gaiellaceae bacterium]|nr:fused MFS/spermidine synthase [Gaiellaceae bacterium]